MGEYKGGKIHWADIQDIQDIDGEWDEIDSKVEKWVWLVNPFQIDKDNNNVFRYQIPERGQGDNFEGSSFES